MASTLPEESNATTLSSLSQRENRQPKERKPRQRIYESQLQAELAVAGLDLDGTTDVHEPVHDEVAAHPGRPLINPCLF